MAQHLRDGGRVGRQLHHTVRVPIILGQTVQYGVEKGQLKHSENTLTLIPIDLCGNFVHASDSLEKVGKYGTS